MAGSSCEFLVLIEPGKKKVVKFHVDDFDNAIDKLDEVIAEFERKAPDALLTETKPFTVPDPQPRTPLIVREGADGHLVAISLAELLGEAAKNAARSKVFKDNFTELINKALAQATSPKLKKALRDAAERVAKGKYRTNPPKTDIEAIGRLLGPKEQRRLLMLYGTAMHEATFALIKKSLAKGYRLSKDQSIRTLVKEARDPELAKRMKMFGSMTVEEYVTKILGRAPGGSKEAKLEEAFIKKFGKAEVRDKSGRPTGHVRDILVMDLKPDIVVMNSANEIRGIYDLTSLQESMIEAAAELAQEELLQIQAWHKRLAKLSKSERAKLIVREADHNVRTLVLSKAKYLHAMRGTVVQDLMKYLGIRTAPGQAGEFYYEALFPWGKPDL